MKSPFSEISGKQWEIPADRREYQTHPAAPLVFPFGVGSTDSNKTIGLYGITDLLDWAYACRDFEILGVPTLAGIPKELKSAVFPKCRGFPKTRGFAPTIPTCLVGLEYILARQSPRLSFVHIIWTMSSRHAEAILPN